MMKRICLFLAAVCFAAFIHAENWMSRLPDDAYVAVLSIPGTHDAATGSGWSAGMEDMGDSWGLTQELTIAQQWEVGIRAFDLRPCLYEDYMNLNHGMIPTKIRFENTVRQLCDSLKANPSEFIIIHLRHENDGDQTSGDYNQRILQFFASEDLAPFLIDFKKNLKVSDIRGKMLFLSRDEYATKPITGGFLANWKHSSNWNDCYSGKIYGRTTSSNAIFQDFYETYKDGALDQKVAIVQRVLKWTMEHKTNNSTGIRWVLSFASGYSKVQSLFGITISLSDGNRDNASHTHTAILNILKEHDPGPTGIIFMDFAGVDRSGNYEVRGRELVQAIIDMNFEYLTIDDRVPQLQVAASHRPVSAFYSLSGTRLTLPRHGDVVLVRHSDGRIVKALYK